MCEAGMTSRTKTEQSFIGDLRLLGLPLNTFFEVCHFCNFAATCSSLEKHWISFYMDLRKNVENVFAKFLLQRLEREKPT